MRAGRRRRSHLQPPAQRRPAAPLRLGAARGFQRDGRPRRRCVHHPGLRLPAGDDDILRHGPHGLEGITRLLDGQLLIWTGNEPFTKLSIFPNMHTLSCTRLLLPTDAQGVQYYDCSAEFRQYWLHTKLGELDTLPHQAHALQAVPTYPCTPGARVRLDSFPADRATRWRQALVVGFCHVSTQFAQVA